MPKFFIISDIHSAYTPMINALKEAGWDENNEDHWIISCGDMFDRMNESRKVMEFIENTNRLILIKGNHESLIRQCLSNRYYQSHDLHNGTVKTIMDLSGLNIDEFYPYDDDFEKACIITEDRINNYINGCLNYFETENYIFVHSWIPTQVNTESYNKFDFYKRYEYNPDWRYAHFKEWEDARWVNPYNMANLNLNKTNKTIVSGHWHCSAYWANKEKRSEFNEDAKFDIAYDDEHQFIGIDACTAYTGKVNVLVIEDNFQNLGAIYG